MHKKRRQEDPDRTRAPDRLKRKYRRQLLSYRLAINLDFWVREALYHMELLEPRLSKEDKDHASSVRKLIRMLQAEMTTWRRLDDTVKPDEIPDEAWIPVAHSGRAIRRIVHASPEGCIFSKGVIGTTTTKCCGGREKEINLWGCAVKGEITKQACAMCDRYIPQAVLALQYPVDLLVGSKECEDCHEIQKQIGRLRGHSRELRIFNTDTDEEFRTLMDDRFERTDLFAPALFSNMAVGLRKCEWSTDDPDEILEYLAREDYIQNG